MQYQLFVQNLAEQRFVASVVGMPTVSEYGTTEEEAVSKAKIALETQLTTGKLITIELPETAAVEFMMGIAPTTKPHNSKFSMQYAGIFVDDYSFDDWVEKLTLLRSQANAETED